MNPLEDCCNRDGKRELEEKEKQRERQTGKDTVNLVGEVKGRREGEMRTRGRKTIKIGQYKYQLGLNERPSKVERRMGRKQ